MEREWRVNPDCVNASNPFHVCAEYCVQRAHVLKPRSPRPKLVVAAQNGERREGDRGMVVAERNVDPSCRNVSNPYHQCAEYCSPRSPQVKEPNGEKRSVDSVVKMEGNQEKKEEMEHKEGGNSIVPAQNEERCKEIRRIVVAERIVDPSCPNASNPFHQCAEYCSPRNPEEKRQREKQSVIGVRMENNRMVDPRCVNASNPYHVCAEYCFQKMKEMKQTEGGKAVVAAHNERREGLKIDVREGLKIDVREGVHPSCINASNPYHKCAEYCFEKINQLM
ncbi:unnamed protein product [Musa hybrid cultivar]